MDLFEDLEKKYLSKPLADRIRPYDLSGFLGQKKLVGDKSLLRKLIESDNICSMIFWGPPGSGKTTLAVIIANMTHSDFITISAVTSGVKEIKSIVETAKINKQHSRKTILFVDEIHRFNKAQQDAFLPHVEDGTLILIGATTENPSFSIIAPLLSRSRVFSLSALSASDIDVILKTAVKDEKAGFGKQNLEIGDDVIAKIASIADGDARRALNLLEISVNSTTPDENGVIKITSSELKEIIDRDHLIYDKSGEEHYNIISALHKSLRGSDPQAAIYWLGRMIESGENPLYVSRRMIRFAVEDIGLADPQALVIANAAWDAFNKLGSPEGNLALYQCAVYLATAPKSNALYVAEGAVKEEIQQSGSLGVPKHIRNAPTSLMKAEGYGKGYLYDHDAPDHFAPQDYLPDAVKTRIFYTPGPFGFEKDIKKRLDWWDKKREKNTK